MSYTLGDVATAERRIRAACPGVHVARTDYGFGLSVAKPDKSAGFIVFQPPRDDKGQPEIMADVHAVIAELTR